MNQNEVSFCAIGLHHAQMTLFCTAPELAQLAKGATNMAMLGKTVWHEKQVDQLKNVILAYHDPFTFKGEDLMSLINQTVHPRNSWCGGIPSICA